MSDTPRKQHNKMDASTLAMGAALRDPEPFFVYAIYDHPKDYPAHVVVRSFEASTGDLRAHCVALFASVEDARDHIAHFYGADCMVPRDLHDDPVIVETWM